MSVRGLVLPVVAAFVGTLAYRVSVPAVAFHAREVMGAAGITVGGLTAAYFAARAPAAAASGRVYGRASVPLSALCFALSGLVALLYAYASTPLHLVLLRALQGALLGFAWTTMQVLLGSHAPRRVRATIYSVYFASGYLGVSAGNAVYALMSSRPLHEVLELSAALFLATSMLTLAIPYAEPPRARQEGGRGGTLWALLAFAGLVQASMALVQGDPAYIVLGAMTGASKGLVAAWLAACTAAALALSFPFSALADRVSPRAAFAAVGFACAAGLTLVAAGPATALAGLTLLAAAARSATPVARKLALEEGRAAGVGYLGAAGNVGVLVGNLALGAALDLGCGAVRALAGIMAVCVAASTAVMARR